MRTRVIFTMRLVGLVIFGLSALGCELNEAPALLSDPDGTDLALLSDPSALGKADGPSRSTLPIGFPEEQDLAILVPMDAEPPLKASLSTRDGGVLLSERWLSQVSDSYLGTTVEDALETENRYEEWQVVSIRIAPCGPLGHFPGHVPDGACWPQVRVVWEPVTEDHMLFGFTWVDRYADDRAIHALYRVAPSAEDLENSYAFETVREQIDGGGALEDLDRELLNAFMRERNLAMMRLTQDVAALRAEDTRDQNWSILDTRSEYNMSDEGPFRFQDRLREFLATYAQPWALHELTSFSLPEGRSPALIDSWVFVAFEGREGMIIQKDITVQSRTTGEVLVNLGTDQTVDGGISEDDAVFEAMEDPRIADEISKQIFTKLSDVEEFGDIIADPTQTFVNNTTCATCHRLTDITFDFHTFSYFEEREATISPRVVEDVSNDLRILRAFIDTWPR